MPPISHVIHAWLPATTLLHAVDTSAAWWRAQAFHFVSRAAHHGDAFGILAHAAHFVTQLRFAAVALFDPIYQRAPEQHHRGGHDDRIDDGRVDHKTVDVPAEKVGRSPADHNTLKNTAAVRTALVMP